ncbi:hypothetical protein KM043_006132 [Ampulex compressa]|nr:hypothetical protein KM043_006132 [Ampulex compressa]
MGDGTRKGRASSKNRGTGPESGTECEARRPGQEDGARGLLIFGPRRRFVARSEKPIKARAARFRAGRAGRVKRSFENRWPRQCLALVLSAHERSSVAARTRWSVLNYAACIFSGLFGGSQSLTGKPAVRVHRATRLPEVGGTRENFSISQQAAPAKEFARGVAGGRARIERKGETGEFGRDAEARWLPQRVACMAELAMVRSEDGGRERGLVRVAIGRQSQRLPSVLSADTKKAPALVADTPWPTQYPTNISRIRGEFGPRILRREGPKSVQIA